MDSKVQFLLLAALLALLGLVLVLDPRTPAYRSQYDPDATRQELARWFRDLQDVDSAPRWDWFDTPHDSPLGAPDFTGRYQFGRQRYRLDIQIRGDQIHYVSQGVDDQVEGGAWFAIGQGRRQPDGRWFTTWSCLDLTRAVSNGGGAWLRFNHNRTHIDVQYYHDTEPLGARPIELGEAVLESAAEPDRKLEGRIPTLVETVHADVEILGRVVDEAGEGIGGAAIQRRAAGRVEAFSDARGFFRLGLERVEALTLIAAGKLGFHNGYVALDQSAALSANGGRDATGHVAMATIVLRRYSTEDHRGYRWVPPQPTPPGINYAPPVHLQCGNCHLREYDAWSRSRHATMAANPWVRAAFEQDAMPAALARGSDRDECTPCHSPSQAASLDRFSLKGPNLLHASGVDAQGNHCDFCHKIESVIDPARPGMDGSLRLLRPDPADPLVPGGIKRVFGSLPDVSYLYMGAAYNPLFQMSLLCAGCHEHELEARPVLGQGTYSEWLRSPAAATGAGRKECQDCHMPQYTPGRLEEFTGPDGRTRRRAVGGDLRAPELENNAIEIARFGTRRRPIHEGHKHSFRGSEDIEFLRQGVSMEVRLERQGGGVTVHATVTNQGAGHAIPTGHGLKRYVLAVIARKDGRVLATDAGLEPAERTGAAQDAAAGALFGRRFGNDWAMPYWRAESETMDTRLQPDVPQVHKFHVADADEVVVRLILRRGPPGLLAQHGFAPDEGRAGRAPLDTVVHEWNSKSP